MTLENLFSIKQLNREAPNRREFEGLLQAAKNRLKDSEHRELSFSSRFDLAYNAAHGFAFLSQLQTNDYGLLYS